MLRQNRRPVAGAKSRPVLGIVGGNGLVSISLHGMCCAYQFAFTAKSPKTGDVTMTIPKRDNAISLSSIRDANESAQAAAWLERREFRRLDGSGASRARRLG